MKKLRIKNQDLIDKLWERKAGFRLLLKEVIKRMEKHEKTT